MKSIVIFYFSGTGNTKIIADLYAQEFKKHGISTEIIPIEDILKGKRKVYAVEYDLIGFGHPVHAFNAPKIFFDFINHLPGGNDRKSFLFKTAGDPLCKGGATHFVRKRLQERDYDIFHEDLHVMPANVAIKFEDELTKQLYEAAKSNVKRHAEEIINHKKRLQKNPLWLRIISYLFSLMESEGAKMFGKHLIVNDDCNLCGKCVQECPTENIIKENGDIKFDKKCALCMRCIYNCPKNAISSKYMDFFIIKEGYNIKPVINNPEIKGNFLSEKTRGFFKHYYSYLTKK